MPGTIVLNEKISFGKNGKIVELESYGFDLSENSIAWTVDEVVGFTGTFPVLPPAANLQLVINATPFIHSPDVPKQELFVYINGLFAGFSNIRAAGEIKIPISRGVLTSRLSRISFVIPTAASPKSLGTGQDIRKLGIAISHLSFVTAK